MDENDYVKKEEYDLLKKQNEQLKRKLEKQDSRLKSIMKMNDNTFKAIFNKNNTLEKNIHRFNRILHQSDRQGKYILVKKEQQEQILINREKMAVMGEMIDNIAHQWRQPLDIISILVQDIELKHMQNKLDENFIDQFTNDVLKQINYMSTTINDFRNFLKDDKVFKDFDFNDTLKKIEMLTKHIVSENHIRLSINNQSNTAKIHGIENELIQVFINLISNCEDAFPKKQNKKTIIVDIKTNSSTMIIKLKDNAGGIEEDLLKKVFESKFTTKKDSGGSGIGLSISKRIIESTFKGNIKVENETFEYEGEKYRGAAFTVTLPLVS